MAGYRFTDQENKEFTLLEDGDYPLEVVGFGFGVSTNGNEQVKLKLSPLDLAVDGCAEECAQVPGHADTDRGCGLEGGHVS
jgi:hypothetical protein